MTELEEAIVKAKDVMEAARKKLGIGGKNGGGAESVYAEAYAALCRLDPSRYQPVRKKYRSV